MIKFYVDQDGNYLGGYDGSPAPDGSIEILSPPNNAKQKWDGSKWLDLVLSWEDQMNNIDISDDLENIIDALDPPTKARIVSETMDKYSAKKLLRSQKP